MIDLDLIFSKDDLFFKDIYFKEIDIQRILDKIEKSNFKDENLSIKLLDKLMESYPLI